MADAETKTKKRNPIDGDAASKTPAKSKLSKEEREAAKVATNNAAKALDDSYKDKPDLVGDPIAEGEKRGRGRPPAVKAPDPLKGGEDGDGKSNSAGAELTQFLERWDRLIEEKKAIADDIKDLKLEIKGRGFDMKATTRLMKVRAMDVSEYQEQEAIFDLYAGAIGLI